MQRQIRSAHTITKEFRFAIFVARAHFKHDAKNAYTSKTKFLVREQSKWLTVSYYYAGTFEHIDYIAYINTFAFVWKKKIFIGFDSFGETYSIVRVTIQRIK